MRSGGTERLHACMYVGAMGGRRSATQALVFAITDVRFRGQYSVPFHTFLYLSKFDATIAASLIRSVAWAWANHPKALTHLFGSSGPSQDLHVALACTAVVPCRLDVIAQSRKICVDGCGPKIWTIWCNPHHIVYVKDWSSSFRFY